MCLPKLLKFSILEHLEQVCRKKILNFFLKKQTTRSYNNDDFLWSVPIQIIDKSICFMIDCGTDHTVIPAKKFEILKS